MRLGDAEFPLSEERFRLLRDMINEKLGIFFSSEKKFLLESRLSERISELGLGSFDEYYQFLKYYPEAKQEMEEVADLLTTNETYFFREDYQLRSFSSDILPELHERLNTRRRLMIWSAGCSSGEEAYTIAMIILDSGLFDSWNVRIFGNDVSRRVLQKARRGIYSPSSFRATKPEFLGRYFSRTDAGMKVCDEVKAICNFGQLNLLDGDQMQLIGRVDVIFCRNVLIYFDKKSKLKAISTFYDKLKPGGYLLLGHTESLLNLSTAFELAHLSEDLVYRKPKIGHGW